MRSTRLPGGADPETIATRQEFAAALTAVREAAGLTVREVARSAGISPSTVGGYFSGRHLPPLRPDGGVRAILRACGVCDPDEVDAWQRALARIRRAPGPRPGAAPPPYRGLATFRPEDVDLFHGREAEAERLVDRLTHSPSAPHDPGAATGGIVVLLGGAGSGKSSLVRAGLLPRLRAAGRPVVVVTPGASPLHDLAGAIVDLVDRPLVDLTVIPPAAGSATSAATDRGPRPTIDPDVVHAALRAEPSAVRGMLPDPTTASDRLIVLPDAGRSPGEEDRRPVLVIDQFENLLGGGASPAEQEVFVTALAAVARAGARGPAPAAVLVVLRSEAVPGIARFPDLAAALRTRDEDAPGRRSRAVHLTSMDDDALRAAILGPARQAGVDVDGDLVEAVLADVADLERQGQAALPRLSHALLATWRRGRRGRLTLAAYREAGGVLGSIESSAEAVYETLPEAARDCLPTLFVPHRDGPDTTPDRTTDDATATAVRALADAGLVEPPLGRPHAPPVGLVQAWPRLRTWLPDSAEPRLLVPGLAPADDPSAVARPTDDRPTDDPAHGRRAPDRRQLDEAARTAVDAHGAPGPARRRALTAVTVLAVIAALVLLLLLITG